MKLSNVWPKSKRGCFSRMSVHWSAVCTLSVKREGLTHASPFVWPLTYLIQLILWKQRAANSVSNKLPGLSLIACCFRAGCLSSGQTHVCHLRRQLWWDLPEYLTNVWKSLPREEVKSEERGWPSSLISVSLWRALNPKSSWCGVIIFSLLEQHIFTRNFGGNQPKSYNTFGAKRKTLHK